MNPINKFLILLFVISAPAVALCNGQESSQYKNLSEARPEDIGMTETEKIEIEIQIKRIEEKLKTEPKVEGWVLVGDANMHLKKYEAAARAYQEAYVLSNYSREMRNKLKKALYFVNAGVEELD